MYGNPVVACTDHARRWQHTAVQVRSGIAASQSAIRSDRHQDKTRQQRGESSAGRESSSTVSVLTPNPRLHLGKGPNGEVCVCASMLVLKRLPACDGRHSDQRSTMQVRDVDSRLVRPSTPQLPPAYPPPAHHHFRAVYAMQYSQHCWAG
jgi:hypothetical protein